MTNKLIQMLGYNRFDDRTEVVLNMNTYQQLDMIKFDIISFRIDNTLPDDQFTIVLRGLKNNN